MPTREQLESGIRKAYEKGEIDLAKRLASELKALPSQGIPTQSQVKATPKDRSFIGMQTSSPFMMGYSDPAAGYAQLASKVAPDSRTPEMVMQGIPSAEERITKAILEREKQYGDRGLDLGRLAGRMVSPGTAPAYMIPIARAGMLPRTATFAAEGAAVGAGEPVVGGDFARQKATQIGIGAGTSAVGGNVIDALVGAFSPAKGIAQRYLKRQFGEDLPKYREAVEGYEQRLPGYKPAVEQVLGQQQRRLVEQGTPDLYSKEAVQLSKDMRTAGKKIGEADIESDLAMKKAVQGEKLTVAEENAARKALGDQADIDYAKATEMIDLPEDLLSRPSVQKALKDTKKAVLESPGRYGDWPEPGEPFTAAQFGRFKRQISSTVSRKLGKKGITKEEAGEIMGTVEEINDILKSKSDAFRIADEKYAEGMAPITAGKVARELEGKLYPQGRARQGAAYIKAIDDERLLTKLAGKPTESISDVFVDPAQKRAVKEMLLDDWATKAPEMRGKSNISNIDGNITFQLPHLLSTPVVITNSILKRIGQDVTPEVHRHIELIMRDPDKFIKVLEGDVNSETTKQAVNLVRRIGAIAAAQSAGDQ